MKFLKICLLFSLLIATTGCWDQKFLSKTSLAFSLGFDVTDDPNTLEVISIIRALKPSGGGQVEPYNTRYKVTGKSPLILRSRMNQITPGEFSVKKLANVIIGEELAKKEIYPLLDVLYRDAKSNVNAKVLITKGKSQKILKPEYIEGTLIGKALRDLLSSAEEHSLIPEQSLATIMPVMFDPGQDFVLPYIEQIQGNIIRIKGVALLDKMSYTGKNLIEEDATLYLLMVGKEGPFVQLSIDDPTAKKGYEQKISIFVRKNQPKIKLKIIDSKPVYSVSLKLKVAVAEYTKGLITRFEKNRLEEQMSSNLTKRAKKVIGLLVDSNCDGLALGRKLMVKDPELFEEYKKNGMLDLKRVEINPTVKVEIVNNGIID